MNDRNLVRGLFLVAVAAAFGLTSLRYTIGTFSQAGPGLFPLMVSCMLGVIGLLTILRSRMVKAEPVKFNVKNIGLILASLCGFAAVSQYLNMIAGIVFMVFCAGLAAKSFSLSRSLKICAGLIAVGFAFQKLLGFDLPLY